MIQLAKDTEIIDAINDSPLPESMPARDSETAPTQENGIDGGGPNPALAPALNLARLAIGSFRLVHYVSLVALVFILAIIMVWLNVSCVRTGYLIETKEVELKSMREEERALTLRLEQMTSPLELRRILDEMNIVLHAGAQSPKRK